VIVLLALFVGFVVGFVVGFALLAWCIVDARLERRRAARAGRLRVHRGGRA